MSLLLYAVSAGVLSTFNPCAYTLLPAILSRFLVHGRGGLGAGLRLGAALTLGTLLAFGGLGLLVALIGLALGRIFPYMALVLAVGFLLMGTLSLSGHSVKLPFSFQAPTSFGFRTYALFGLAFGLASLGCTLPIFLTVAGLGLAEEAAFGFLMMLTYGLSIGAVLTSLSVLTALGRAALLKQAGRIGRFVEPLGSVLLLAAAGYLLYTNLGFLTFNYELGWWLGVLSAGSALLLGLGLRYLGRGESVPA